MFPPTAQPASSIHGTCIPEPPLVFNEKALTLEAILDQHSLPRVIKCEKSPSASRQKLRSNLDICQPLLAFRARSVRKVSAHSLQFNPKDGDFFTVGNGLLIPEDYPGWFAVMGAPDSVSLLHQSIPHYTSVSYLATSGCGHFLVGGEDSVHGFLNDKTKATRYQVLPGTVLRPVGLYQEGTTTTQATKKMKKPPTEVPASKFLKCLDEDNREIFIPVHQKGVFYVLSRGGLPALPPILQMQGILKRFSFPVIVKLLYGRVPLTPCSFTQVLLLTDSGMSHTLVASTLLCYSNVNIEIPVGTELKFNVAENTDELLVSKDYTNTLTSCQEKTPTYVKDMKVVFGSAQLHHDEVGDTNGKQIQHESQRLVNDSLPKSSDNHVTIPNDKPVPRQTDDLVPRPRDNSLLRRNDKPVQGTTNIPVPRPTEIPFFKPTDISDPTSADIEDPKLTDTSVLRPTDVTVPTTCDKPIPRSRNNVIPRPTDNSTSRINDKPVPRPRKDSFPRPTDIQESRPSDNSNPRQSDTSDLRPSDDLSDFQESPPVMRTLTSRNNGPSGDMPKRRAIFGTSYFSQMFQHVTVSVDSFILADQPPTAAQRHQPSPSKSQKNKSEAPGQLELVTLYDPPNHEMNTGVIKINQCQGQSRIHSRKVGRPDNLEGNTKVYNNVPVSHCTSSYQFGSSFGDWYANIVSSQEDSNIYLTSWDADRQSATILIPSKAGQPVSPARTPLSPARTPLSPAIPPLSPAIRPASPARTPLNPAVPPASPTRTPASPTRTPDTANTHFHYVTMHAKLPHKTVPTPCALRKTNYTPPIITGTPQVNHLSPGTGSVTDNGRLVSGDPRSLYEEDSNNLRLEAGYTPRDGHLNNYSEGCQHRPNMDTRRGDYLQLLDVEYQIASQQDVYEEVSIASNNDYSHSVNNNRTDSGVYEDENICIECCHRDQSLGRSNSADIVAAESLPPLPPRHNPHPVPKPLTLQQAVLRPITQAPDYNFTFNQGNKQKLLQELRKAGITPTAQIAFASLQWAKITFLLSREDDFDDTLVTLLPTICNIDLRMLAVCLRAIKLSI